MGNTDVGLWFNSSDGAAVVEAGDEDGAPSPAVLAMVPFKCSGWVRHSDGSWGLDLPLNDNGGMQDLLSNAG